MFSNALAPSEALVLSELFTLAAKRQWKTIFNTLKKYPACIPECIGYTLPEPELPVNLFEIGLMQGDSEVISEFMSIFKDYKIRATTQKKFLFPLIVKHTSFEYLNYLLFHGCINIGNSETYMQDGLYPYIVIKYGKDKADHLYLRHEVHMKPLLFSNHHSRLPSGMFDFLDQEQANMMQSEGKKNNDDDIDDDIDMDVDMNIDADEYNDKDNDIDVDIDIDVDDDGIEMKMKSMFNSLAI